MGPACRPWEAVSQAEKGSEGTRPWQAVSQAEKISEGTRPQEGRGAQ